VLAGAKFRICDYAPGDGVRQNVRIFQNLRQQADGTTAGPTVKNVEEV